MQINDIIIAVCKALDLDNNKLSQKKQGRQYRDARFITVFIVRSLLIPKKQKVKYAELAQIFQKDSKQHATMIYSFRISETLLKTDKKFKEKFIKVLETL